MDVILLGMDVVYVNGLITRSLNEARFTRDTSG